MEGEFNGFLPPSKEMPIPDGMRIMPGNPNDDSTPYVRNYKVNPIINEGHFQMNIGGQVPSSWSMNQIAHYVKFAGPSDSVFAEKAKELLRERGYNV
ncbi:IMC-associated apicomplexan protein, putative gamete release protein, putative [Plasmodium vinckei brucechwatti]|uniref:IMC-associated apicomplexan protein, putative gamete release protein, putative n=1 Tax=Plasmodium vinckei brucechwatti TaxID=119398 RepID=A0A6V7SK26_PLAVN|nr:IMC-associated apicomplexan protein, putative gamete release protein, putative [Plasmodium vinckei brucechwatti]